MSVRQKLGRPSIHNLDQRHLNLTFPVDMSKRYDRTQA
jgi:hypothetical protein